MKQRSDMPSFILKYILIPAVIVKLIYSILLLYLDKSLLPPSSSGNISFITKTKLAYKILEAGDDKPKTVEKVGKKITDFKLKGTYVAGDDSFVIIDDKGSTEFVYMGESYQGYKLTNVYENRAIFAKDGQKYELAMYAQSSSSRYTTDTSTQPIKRATRDDYTVPVDIQKEDINYYVQNPDKIWNNIRIRDYRTPDGIEFKVNYVRKGTIFDKIGLKPGDIITAIEGQRVESMADVMKYYSDINSLDSLMITIKRAGQEMDIDFRIKE